MSRKTLKHVRRLAHLAELRIVAQRPGDGTTRYEIYDGRDRTESHRLFYAVDGHVAEAFICGWTQGRNREIIK